MKLQLFRKIVNTKIHLTHALNNPKSLYHWENTNKLLGRKEHWVGCKTGVTDPAGPCFSGFYEDSENGDRYCVVVLHSKTMETRWVEVPKMVKWAIDCKRMMNNKDITLPIVTEGEKTLR
jgi:D-alanyl-D-alanine carboxypeptidase